jgi:hypothetical protein
MFRTAMYGEMISRSKDLIIQEEPWYPGVKGLTIAEKRWLNELQDVFNRCPERLAFVNIGDPYFHVVDGDVVEAESLEIHDGLATRQGLVIAWLPGGPRIYGTTG